ncbi:hypothetical protein F5B22DRAFT_28041 [Xylaria bambusicola]|uniref:uncharacterized protein n=1 Tax=Xylaria bambusicola TaxID=326684 RepID=UPI002008D1ED|nr:uncharacterized protein F5B22DRAFT_28041 [Xylaria bambusicola]KAI0528245.1 hypothetical protein F5B22DRAFT_28041 [Xylaria bambusicola]
MAASSSALSQLKPFTLNSRSLFVKCVPAPKTFYERRAVLAALQKSSQQSIEMFKKLQDSSSFIAITTRPDAATTLVESSPLERTIVSQHSGSDSPGHLDDDVSGTIAAPISPLPTNPIIQPTPASIKLGLSHKTFTLHIFPVNAGYDHREEVRKNPLYGPWPGSGTTETFVSAALRRVIPSGVMAPALYDWETGNPLAHESDSFAENGRGGAAFTLLGKKRHSAREAFVLERIRRREAKQATPTVMGSLVQFTEECRNRSASKQPETPQDTAAEPMQAEAETQVSNSPSDTTNDTEIEEYEKNMIKE